MNVDLDSAEHALAKLLPGAHYVLVVERDGMRSVRSNHPTQTVPMLAKAAFDVEHGPEPIDPNHVDMID